MSKFTQEWQKLRKDLGHMVSVMESMAVKYGDCTEIEAKAYEKGHKEGYNAGVKKQKEEFCKECTHKATAEAACKYARLLKEIDDLSYDEREIIENLIEHFLDRGRD